MAALALLISLYTLAAILYRTANGHLTPNRLLFIGWNVINIAILALLLILQGRAGRARWLPAMHRAFAIGTVLYLIWAVVGLLAPPWLFRGDPGRRPSAAEDPGDRLRPARADPAEMPDQPPHLPAGSRSETLDEGHPYLRGRGVSLERRASWLIALTCAWYRMAKRSRRVLGRRRSRKQLRITLDYNASRSHHPCPIPI